MINWGVFMDNQENHKKNEPKIAEVLSDEEKDVMVPQKDSEIEVFHKPSKIPFVNKLHKLKIDSFKNYVKSETELMEAGISHKLTKGKLKDIDIEIEADQLERRQRLQDLKREQSIQSDKDTLAELDVKLKIAEAENGLRKFKSGFDPDEYRRGKEEKEQKKDIDYELKLKNLKKEIQEGFDRKSVIEYEITNETRKRIQKVRDDKSLTNEQRDVKIGQIIEDMEDYKDQLIEGLKEG